MCILRVLFLLWSLLLHRSVCECHAKLALACVISHSSSFRCTRTASETISKECCQPSAEHLHSSMLSPAKRYNGILTSSYVSTKRSSAQSCCAYCWLIALQLNSVTTALVARQASHDHTKQASGMNIWVIWHQQSQLLLFGTAVNFHAHHWHVSI